jgi:hypothetical protein
MLKQIRNVYDADRECEKTTQQEIFKLKIVRRPLALLCLHGLYESDITAHTALNHACSLIKPSDLTK